jgi:hypothetical protein
VVNAAGAVDVGGWGNGRGSLTELAGSDSATADVTERPSLSLLRDTPEVDVVPPLTERGCFVSAVLPAANSSLEVVAATAAA